MSTVAAVSGFSETGKLHRTIDWTGAFWVASGVPALALFSIGGIAGTVGTSVEIGKLDGHRRRIAARVVAFPHFDPRKTRAGAEGPRTIDPSPPASDPASVATDDPRGAVRRGARGPGA